MSSTYPDGYVLGNDIPAFLGLEELRLVDSGQCLDAVASSRQVSGSARQPHSSRRSAVSGQTSRRMMVGWHDLRSTGLARAPADRAHPANPTGPPDRARSPHGSVLPPHAPPKIQWRSVVANRAIQLTRMEKGFVSTYDACERLAAEINATMASKRLYWATAPPGTRLASARGSEHIGTPHVGPIEPPKTRSW